MYEIVRARLDKTFRRLVDLKLEIGLRIGRQKYRVIQPEQAQVVVSMTSYPARIEFAWISLETLFRQDFQDFAIVLVLAKSQFPGGRLPKSIRKLQGRGLRVLWVDKDGKSADHIWPAYFLYNNARIVSVDDDKFFPPDLLTKLTAEANRSPGAIVGARGWQMAEANGTVAFGEGWSRANLSTPSPILFMPPGNGSLYPPGSLPEMAGDYELMSEICPTADDVWFWAMGLQAGTESKCLGMNAHRPVIRQLKTESLASLNAGPAQFRAVLKHFHLESKVLAAIRLSRG